MTKIQNAVIGSVRTVIGWVPAGWLPGGSPDPLIERRAAIGRQASRLDGPLKVAGEARFAAEVVVDNLAHAALVYSPITRGRIARLDTDAAEAAPGVLPASAGQGETIVLIEDEPALREIVEEVLREAGYRVITAQDGPTGLQILNSDTRVDLLVTDVGLPGGLNGRQVADAARLQRPGLKVLFVTGYADTAAVGNGRLAPGMEVITKPFEIGALAYKIRALILEKH